MRAREDGEFWMSFEDFKIHFSNFEICCVTIDQLYEDESGSYHSLYNNYGVII